MNLLLFPRTFAYKINEWPDKIEKNTIRDYPIIYSSK